MMRALMMASTTALSLGAFQQPTELISAAVDRQEMTVGDRVVFTITIEHAGDLQVAWPPAPEMLGPFEVLEHAILDSGTVDNRIRSMSSYVLTVFEIGDLEIPSVDLGWERDGVAGDGDFATDPVTVRVVSVELEQPGDIRDIKPPVEMARNWILLMPWLLGAALLGALVYWLHRRFRGRSRPLPAVPAVPPRPPHDVALEALDRLEASPLLERGEIKQYFVQVSRIVRVYVEGRYGFVALEMTSRDIVIELERVRLERSQVDLFEEFFRQSDLVKFAKDRPEIERCKQLIPMARELIDGTRERPAEGVGSADDANKERDGARTAAGVEVG